MRRPQCRASLDAWVVTKGDHAIRPVPSPARWPAFPLLSAPLRLGVGAVAVVVDVRMLAILPDLPDHQSPREGMACLLGAIEDAVFTFAADRTVATVHCFPLQHGHGV